MNNIENDKIRKRNNKLMEVKSGLADEVAALLVQRDWLDKEIARYEEINRKRKANQ